MTHRFQHRLTLPCNSRLSFMFNAFSHSTHQSLDSHSRESIAAHTNTRMQGRNSERKSVLINSVCYYLHVLIIKSRISCATSTFFKFLFIRWQCKPHRLSFIQYQQKTLSGDMYFRLLNKASNAFLKGLIRVWMLLFFFLFLIVDLFIGFKIRPCSDFGLSLPLVGKHQLLWDPFELELCGRFWTCHAA